MAAISGSKKTDPAEGKKNEMGVASSPGQGENTQPSPQGKDAAGKIKPLMASSGASTSWKSPAAGEAGQPSKEQKSGQQGVKRQQEGDPVETIGQMWLAGTWVHNKLERVGSLEEYEQHASYVWRVTADGAVLVVPGTPPALVEWEGGPMQSDEEMPAATAQVLDQILCPKSPIEPVLRALNVCSSG